MVLVVGWFLTVARFQPPGSCSLVVYSYSAFVNAWGPGPLIAKGFEQQSHCKVDLVDGGDAGLLVQRVVLEKDKSPADLILGLDNLGILEAQNKIVWKKIADLGIRWDQSPVDLKGMEKHEYFLPFDWAPLTFVLRLNQIEPPKKIDDLLETRFTGRIALEDPRTSSPGLQFFFWILALKGEEEGFKFLEQLKPSIHSVSPSWSTAYGLFKKGQADMAFSYLTSPVYHWVEEQKTEYQAVGFEEPLAVQVEYAGVPASCRNCEKATEFLRFLIQDRIQAIIMQKNYMLPVRESVMKETPFAKLPQVQIISADKMAALYLQRERLLGRWTQLWQ